MSIIETTVPENSILHLNYKKYDYEDCFKGKFVNPENISPAEACKAFIGSQPKWVLILLAIRNKLVALLGLKVTGNPSKWQVPDTFNFEPGEQFGIGKVFDKTSNEIVWGVDDRHLDFRGSILLENEEKDNQIVIFYITRVKFNNQFGRFYFFIVKPFHKIIMKVILKKMIINLKKHPEKIGNYVN